MLSWYYVYKYRVYILITSSMASKLFNFCRQVFLNFAASLLRRVAFEWICSFPRVTMIMFDNDLQQLEAEKPDESEKGY